MVFFPFFSYIENLGYVYQYRREVWNGSFGSVPRISALQQLKGDELAHFLGIEGKRSKA
jgi:hypothetical protein